MKKQFIFIAMITSILFAACKQQTKSVIPEKVVNNVISQLVEKHGILQEELIGKGVKQMAAL